MLKNTARKIAFILVLALCGCTQSSFENNLAQVTEEPSSCLPLNLRSDPTVQPAIQFNLQCTQNSCGQLYYSCTGNSTCNQGICTACDLNQTGCLLAESLRTTQATSQLKACKGDEKCLPWMCVDTQSNANYCGACGKECASGESCVRGICSTPQYLVYSGLRLVLENNAKLDSNDTRGTLIALGAAVDVNGSDRRPIMTRDGKFVGITTLQLGGDAAYPKNNTKVVYTDQFITDATNNTASLYLNTDGKIGAYYGGGYLYNLVGTTGNDFFFYFFYSDKPDPKIHSWKLCTPTDTSCLKPLPPPTRS